jgi:hypothetical protein
MGQVEQNLEPLLYYLPGTPPVRPYDKPHPAGIALI